MLCKHLSILYKNIKKTKYMIFNGLTLSMEFISWTRQVLFFFIFKSAKHT